MSTLFFIILLFACGFLAGNVYAYNKAIDRIENIIKRLADEE